MSFTPALSSALQQYLRPSVTGQALFQHPLLLNERASSTPDTDCARNQMRRSSRQTRKRKRRSSADTSRDSQAKRTKHQVPAAAASCMGPSTLSLLDARRAASCYLSSVRRQSVVVKAATVDLKRSSATVRHRHVIAYMPYIVPVYTAHEKTVSASSTATQSKSPTAVATMPRAGINMTHQQVMDTDARLIHVPVENELGHKLTGYQVFRPPHPYHFSLHQQARRWMAGTHVHVRRGRAHVSLS